MIPAAFEYERAESIVHALDLLAHNEDAKLLAGGHSLLPLMKLRLARPSMLVDIGRLHDLSYIREDGDAVAVGALTRHHDVEHSDVLKQHCPILAHAAGEIGDPQVRHVGTIGGSVAHGDPASDLPGVLLTLDAEFVVRGPEGSRTVAASDFFTGFFETVLSPGEMVTEIRVPKLPTGTGWSYQKFHRRAQDWAVVGVAAVLQRSNGSVSNARVGLVNMGDRPLRAGTVEEALAGGTDPGSAAEGVAEGTNPPTDTFGSAEYRRDLAKVLARRAVEEALGR
jgi:carbon-monoxide dehydrogenase medium subunit